MKELKNNCYWLLKYNALKIKYDILENQIGKNIREEIEWHIDNQVEVDFYKKKNQLLRKQLKELKEQMKEGKK
jgi:hypothetical protein